jgi:hypothetical protein
LGNLQNNSCDKNHRDAEGNIIPKWPQSPLKRGTQEIIASQMRKETKKEFSKVVAKGNAAYAKAKKKDTVRVTMDTTMSMAPSKKR